MNDSTRFEDILERDGRLIYTNKGHSMMPLLREGKDLMVIDRKGPGPLKLYDAVLFTRPGVKGRGAYVLHRILRVNGDGTYYIVGDNCYSGERVSEERILGVLTAVVRNGKQISMDSPAMRLYVRLWAAHPRMRSVVMFPRRAAGRCWRGLLRLTGKRRR